VGFNKQAIIIDKSIRQIGKMYFPGILELFIDRNYYRASATDGKLF